MLKVNVEKFWVGVAWGGCRVTQSSGSIADLDNFGTYYFCFYHISFCIIRLVGKQGCVPNTSVLGCSVTGAFVPVF